MSAPGSGICKRTCPRKLRAECIQVNNYTSVNITDTQSIPHCRSFMSEKMKSRVKISKHEIKMAEFVNLPSDLGGTGESYAELALHWKRKVQEHAAWYAETEQYQKRPA